MLHAMLRAAVRDFYAQEVLRDSPVAYWRLGEASGTTAVDEAGSNDGTYSGVTLGAAGLLAGDTNTAAEFNNSTDYIEVADHADFEVSTFTFECWVKHDAPTTGDLFIIADKTGTASANNSFGCWYDNRSSQGSPRRIRFQGPDGNVNWEGTAVSDAVATGVHLVFVGDGTSGEIYADGVLVASGTIGANGTNSLPLRIGQIANGTHDGWDGTLDEAAFYDTALSPARIEAHYNAGTT